MSIRRRAVAASFTLVLLLTLSLVGPAAAHTPYCGIRWGSLAKVVEPRASSTPLTNARVGRHACFDRLVIDMAGPAKGYSVVAQRTDDGRVFLSVVVAGVVPQQALGRFEPSVAGFRTFRDVTFGGTGTQAVGSTSMSVQLRARLPFRVFVLPGSGGYAAPGTQARLVIDVAHRW